MAETGKADRSGWLLALVGVSGILGGALITGAFNYFDHQRDLDGKMIELSISILRAEPTSETIPLREWAIDIMDNRAGFSFNRTQRAVLLKQGLPIAPAPVPGAPPGSMACAKPGTYCGPGYECAPEGNCRRR
jgi:hypothetical protein